MLMAVHLIDNVAVDWMKAVVQSYVYTMKQLVQNTFSELHAESWSSGSPAPALTSQDMVVLVTAFISLFGLGISLSAVFGVYRVVCWICVDQPTNGRSELSGVCLHRF